MNKLLEKLVAPVSASGCEGSVSKVLAELATPYGTVSSDHLGNLVVHKVGNGKRILLSAHMDTIGVVATYIDDKGFVRFGKLGGLNPVNAVSTRVVFESGTIGVICCERGTEPKDLTPDKLYIDTAGQPVRVGETAVFCQTPVFVGDKVISAYLDNRLGCAVCLKALSLLKDTDNDIFCVFSVQEELGCRGAGAAAFSICPDMAIAVDICGVGDAPGAATQDDLTLEGGPVVKLLDKSFISHSSVSELLERSAAKLGIPVQRYVALAGGTDSGTIQRSRSGVPTGCLSIPIRYTHSPNELGDLRVAAQCAQLLAAAISE